MKRDVNAEVSIFKQKAAMFWSDSKKKAQAAMAEIKSNVEKVNANHDAKYGSNANRPIGSAGIQLRQDSAFYDTFHKNSTQGGGSPYEC